MRNISRHRGKQTKSLLIYDLNGVLGYMTHNHAKTSKGIGIYGQGELKVGPDWSDEKTAVYKRPNLHKIADELMIGNKRLYDIGIWSGCDYNDTKLMIEKLFGRYYTQ